MAKTLSRTNDTDHLRRIGTEPIIKVGDVIAASQIITVPPKWRLASELFAEENIEMTI
jgi:hypothetical protein